MCLRYGQLLCLLAARRVQQLNTPPSHTRSLHLHDYIRGLSLSLMYQDYDRNLNSKLGLEQLMTAYTMQGKYVILIMLTGSSYRWKNGLR